MLENKLDSMISKGEYIIVFDTNIYLNLYEYSPEISEFYVKICNKIIDRLYMPKTVEIEFKENYIKKQNIQKNKFKNVPKKLKTHIQNMESKLDTQLHILKEFKFTNLDELEMDVKTKIEEIHNIMDKYILDNKTLDIINRKASEEDKIELVVKQIHEKGHLFEGLTIEKIYKLCDMGKKRYEEKKPPGYMDQRDKNSLRRYNDFIIWSEALEFCKNRQLDLIFVTDDKKEDWYDSEKKFNIELIKEFEKFTSREILGIDSNKFFSSISKMYNMTPPDTLEWLLKNDSYRYANEVADDIVLNEKLNVYDKLEDFIDINTLTNYDGFELDVDYDSLSYDLLSYDFTGHLDNEALYRLQFAISVDAISYQYWGRDDETKEILLSPGTIHSLQGTLLVEIIRNIDMPIDEIIEDSSYEDIEIISGELVEEDVEFWYQEECEEEYV